MKTTRVNRKLSAYSIHAHANGRAIDYTQLFAMLHAMERSTRSAKIAGLTIVITDIVPIEDFYFLTFVEGEEGVRPLILHLDTGETRLEELGEREMLGSASHAMVYPMKRRILVEYVKSAPKQELMARTIEELLRRDYGPDFRIDFSPVVEENFIKQIDQFRRIRAASITLIKPNAGWDDHFTKLSALLEESGGQTAELAVKAARAESLSKDSGIIEVIKDVVNDAQPYLQDAVIVGIKEGEETETTLPLNRHVLHRNVSVPREQDGGINTVRLREIMIQLMGILF